MRIKEILGESRERGKMLKAQKKVNPGAVFTPSPYFDFYRAGLLMARSPEEMGDLDPYSWITGLPYILTYTQEERDMVRKAFKKMGIPFKEHVPQGSEEPDPVNKVSPVKGFKGYPR